MFYLCKGACRSLLMTWCAWLILCHASAALAESPEPHDSDHIDTVSTNPRLTLHEVLQQVVAIHPQQSLLAAHQQMVQARRTMANSWLPQTPLSAFRTRAMLFLAAVMNGSGKRRCRSPSGCPGSARPVTK